MHIWWYRSSIYPAAIAPAIAKPSAADFPRPRAASRATVLRSVLSKTASRKVTTAFPYSHKRTYLPTQICLFHLITRHQTGNS